MEKIASPCISTGIYGYPKDLAAPTAVDVAKSKRETSLSKVIFCRYGQQDYDIYRSRLPESYLLAE